MPFVPKKQAFNAHINEVVLGVGDKATAIGGQNVLPFHTFDAEIKNAPKIGVELTDFGMEERSEERRVGKECRSRWSPYH